MTDSSLAQPRPVDYCFASRPRAQVITAENGSEETMGARALRPDGGPALPSPPAPTAGTALRQAHRRLVYLAATANYRRQDLRGSITPFPGDL
jgi:hypothetical protein